MRSVLTGTRLTRFLSHSLSHTINTHVQFLSLSLSLLCTLHLEHIVGHTHTHSMCVLRGTCLYLLSLNPLSLSHTHTHVVAWPIDDGDGEQVSGFGSSRSILPSIERTIFSHVSRVATALRGSEGIQKFLKQFATFEPQTLAQFSVSNRKLSKTVHYQTSLFNKNFIMNYKSSNQLKKQCSC